MPPAYSAVKVGGRKLYEAARAGEALEAPARPIVVHDFAVTRVTGDDVDVRILPTLKYHELDSGAVDPGFEDIQGRYITLGAFLCAAGTAAGVTLVFQEIFLVRLP